MIQPLGRPPCHPGRVILPRRQDLGYADLGSVRSAAYFLPFCNCVSVGQAALLVLVVGQANGRLVDSLSGDPLVGYC